MKHLNRVKRTNIYKKNPFCGGVGQDKLIFLC